MGHFEAFSEFDPVPIRLNRNSFSQSESSPLLFVLIPHFSNHFVIDTRVLLSAFPVRL